MAHATLLSSFKLDAKAGQAKEIMASPAKLTARTDWTFTFTDATVAPLPQGEPRVTVVSAREEGSTIRALDPITVGSGSCARDRGP